MKWDINLALSYLGRQGFPFPASILTPNRANSAGTAQVILDPLGDVRYDSLNTFDMVSRNRCESSPRCKRT